MRFRFAALSLAALAGLSSANALAPAASSFVTAPAGIALPFGYVALPDVALSQQAPLPGPRIGGAFGPTVQDLVSGEFVIETEQQMRLIWRALFAVPYDASLFDFSNDAVLWMGGNSMQLGSFGISSVERVDAEWQNFMFGPQNEVDSFVATTSTTFFPGAFPQDPPPFTWRVSAVRIAKSDLDDVVFHRTFIFAP